MPAPRATNGISCSAHTATTRWTSSAVPGRTAAIGSWRKCASPSERYVASACGWVSTCSAPQIPSSRAISSVPVGIWRKYSRYRRVTLSCVELKTFYEESYSRGDDGGELYADWRALSAVGKADHVLALTPRASRGRPLRVLDIGCGDGALIAELSRREPSWRFAGVEIAERAVDLARGTVSGG